MRHNVMPLKVRDFVDGLTVEEEDRVLVGKLCTGRMYPWTVEQKDQCLVGAAKGVKNFEDFVSRMNGTKECADQWNGFVFVGIAFDNWVHEVGIAAATAEVRERIWYNRLQTMLAGVDMKQQVMV